MAYEELFGLASLYGSFEVLVVSHADLLRASQGLKIFWCLQICDRSTASLNESHCSLSTVSNFQSFSEHKIVEELWYPMFETDDNDWTNNFFRSASVSDTFLAFDDPEASGHF